MPSVDDLQRHLGDRPMPLLLRELFEFADEVDDWFSGHIELTDSDGGSPGEELIGYLDGGVERFGAEFDAAFVVFAMEGDGSQYALWSYDGRSLDQAPVVYISSENYGNKVVAGDLREFVSLMLLDIDEMHFGVFTEVAESPCHDEFVDWAAERGITPPADPKVLMAQAVAAHPDFHAWLNERYDALSSD